MHIAKLRNHLKCSKDAIHLTQGFGTFYFQAVKMDVTEGGDDEAVTSSMVDDVFFIVQKAVRQVTNWENWTKMFEFYYESFNQN